MTSTPARVMVVEDNPLLADVMRFNLQRAKLDVIVAHDGAIALAYLQREPVDLLITDYQMPGMNGVELCSRVREQLALKSLPILMCSAKGCELDMQLLKDSFGVAQVIFKPFSMRHIVEQVRTLIEAPKRGLACELVPCGLQLSSLLQPSGSSSTIT